MPYPPMKEHLLCVSFDKETQTSYIQALHDFRSQTLAKRSVASVELRLRQLCGLHSGKMQVLMELLRTRFSQPSEKVVIFSRFFSSLRPVYEEAVTQGILNPHEIALYRGGNQSHKEREQILRNFQQDPSLRMIVVFDVVCNGTNFSAANTLIHLDMVPPNTLAQRNHRVLFRNVHDHVKVYTILTESSIEEEAYHQEMKKRKDELDEFNAI